ncbi:MAG: hypothetical protein HY897_09880 [Deltaproteobacteria bacterium]|nr:hypothetical protein [Deltaproteobacteria bacterium]
MRDQDHDGADGRAQAVVLLSNPKTGKPIIKTVESAGKASSDDTSVFALKIVEALRAGLLDMGLPDVSRKVVVKRQAEKEETKPQTEKEKTKPWFNAVMGIGGGALGLASDAGPVGNANVILRSSVFPSFAIQVEGLFTYPAKDSQNGEERSSLSVAIVRAWGLWEPVEWRFLRLSTGLGSGLVTMSGVRSGAIPAHNRTSTAYVGATAQITATVWRSLGFSLGLNAGRSLPEVQVNFTDSKAAAFGKPPSALTRTDPLMLYRTDPS